MKTYSSTLASLLFVALSANLSAADTPSAVKANILFIVADDMGYSDAGCYGSEIHTPNLDALASGGLRFTQFYNTARCWSSRACIMTGYYAQSVRRDGLTGIQREPGEPVAGGVGGVRPRWAQMLPAILKPLGYRSYHSGKWHLDGEPLENGFDHSYFEMNAEGYFASTTHREDGKKLPPAREDGSYYSTTAIADYGIKYLKEHAAKFANQPFFEYLAFHSPHFPIQAPAADIAIYKDRYQSGWDAMREERLTRMKKLGIVDCDLSKLEPEVIPHWNFSEGELKRRISTNEVGHAVPWNSLTPGEQEFQAEKMSVHAAMVHRMDIEIGRVLDQLKAMGAYDKTLVVFVSDNGASAEQIIRERGHVLGSVVGSSQSYLGIGPGWSSLCNTPFRLHKSWNHEGGISTPLIVHWPAGISAHGELRTNPGHLIDLVPTVLEITGAKVPEKVAGLDVPPLQGKSLVPAFTKNGSVNHDYLWWNHDGNRAIRIGDLKLVSDHQKPWELFDLSEDRSETKNLADLYPGKVIEMAAAWLKHAEEFHVLSLSDPPTYKKKSKPSDK